MKNIYLLLTVNVFCLLSACQSIPPSEAPTIDNDVCIGEPVVIDDPDKPIDLEEMAKQAECP